MFTPTHRVAASLAALALETERLRALLQDLPPVAFATLIAAAPWGADLTNQLIDLSAWAQVGMGELMQIVEEENPLEAAG